MSFLSSLNLRFLARFVIPAIAKINVVLFVCKYDTLVIHV